VSPIPGPLLGVELDGTFGLSTDAVTGLSAGSPFFLGAYASVGWRLELGPYFALDARFLIGTELAWLHERVEDASLGIDAAYSSFDAIFDYGARALIAWYPFGAFGCTLSLFIDFYDLRKSLATFGLSYRIE
jgi:hypothetical protein